MAPSPTLGTMKPVVSKESLLEKLTSLQDISIKLVPTRRNSDDIEKKALSKKARGKKCTTTSFLDWLVVSSKESIKVPDVHDDLQRELSFYQQALKSVLYAKEDIKAAGLPFSPPADYFPLMVKTQEHMTKIQKSLEMEHEEQKNREEVRKQRTLKKFGKQIQQQKLLERQAEKSEAMKEVNAIAKDSKRKLAASMVAVEEHDSAAGKKFSKKASHSSTIMEDDGDEFDIKVDDDAEEAEQKVADKFRRELTNNRAAQSGQRNDRRSTKKTAANRSFKDSKFGFGGKKRNVRSNDKDSASDMSGFSSRQNRASFFGTKNKGGVQKKKQQFNRPGNAKRTQMRHRK